MTRHLLLFILICGAPAAAFAASQKPNIVLIFTDGRGYGDPGAFGSTTIRTPRPAPTNRRRPPSDPRPSAGRTAVKGR